MGEYKKVICKTEDTDWGARVGRICKIVRKYFYACEYWYTLKDIETCEKFESPVIYWEDTN